MGWTSMPRTSGQDLKSTILNEFSNTSDDPHAGPQDIAIVRRNTAYIAYREPGPGGKCFALIVLLRHEARELMMKDMSEFEGPNESECPERILDLLTPLDDRSDPRGWARAWRARCRANHQRRARARALAPGDVIRFPNPFSFSDGTTLRSFVVDRLAPGKPLRLHAIVGFDEDGRARPSYGHYRIRNWRARDFERLTLTQARRNYQQERAAAFTTIGGAAT